MFKKSKNFIDNTVHKRKDWNQIYFIYNIFGFEMHRLIQCTTISLHVVYSSFHYTFDPKHLSEILNRAHFDNL